MLHHCLVCLVLVGCAGAPGSRTVASGSAEAPEWIDELEPDARPVVSAGYGAVMACAGKVHDVDGPLAGELKVMIGTQNGRVKTWAVLTNGTGSPEAAECVLGTVRKWRFPKGYDSSMKLPFEFGG